MKKLEHTIVQEESVIKFCAKDKNLKTSYFPKLLPCEGALLSGNELSARGILKTEEVLDETEQALVAGIAGILSSERKDLFLSAGHILQRIRGKSFLEAFREEWGRYVEKGKVKPDFLGSTQQFNSLHELLTALDTPQTDDVTLELLKKIYLVSASDTSLAADSLLPIEYIRLAKKLSGTSLLILFANHRAYTKHGGITSGGADKWVKLILAESGLQFPSLVENYEQELIDTRLIADRDYSDRSGIRRQETLRLTDLGLSFCEFINKYEALTA